MDPKYKDIYLYYKDLDYYILVKEFEDISINASLKKENLVVVINLYNYLDLDLPLFNTEDFKKQYAVVYSSDKEDLSIKDVDLEKIYLSRDLDGKPRVVYQLKYTGKESVPKIR
jgi:hypothetical protein